MGLLENGNADLVHAVYRQSKSGTTWLASRPKYNWSEAAALPSDPRQDPSGALG